MPRPRRFLPRGLSDATDGTEAPAGACAQLVNLIPQPNSKVMVPRPAMIPQTELLDWARATTAMQGIGNKVYGMAGSVFFSGKDAPFMYDAATEAFTTIFGVFSSLLPTSPATSGDWTPPTVNQIAGRVVFTHPGFPGGTTFPLTNIKFAASVTSGSTTIIGPDYLYTLPVAGLSILDSAGAFPANTTAASAVPLAFTTTATGTSGTNTMTVASAAGIAAGQSIFFPGAQSIIESIVGTTVTVHDNLTVSFTGATVYISGTVVTASRQATATTTTVAALQSPPPAIKFGWIDLSSFQTTIVANGTGGPFLTGAFSLVGVQPGMSVSGPGILANTTVVNFANINFPVYGATAANSQFLNLGNYPANGTPDVGMFISGPNIPTGTFVVNYDVVNNVIGMSNAATATAFAQFFTVSGQIIQLSQSVSSLSIQKGYTIAGGSPSAPLWGAGDMAVNPLAAVPVFVNTMFNRAYFGINTATTAGVQASDAGTACVQTFTNQTLTFSSPVPVSAATSLQLSTLTGGGVQSLIVFQSDTDMVQITGDFLTSSIAVNALTNPAGTLAPNTISPTPRGVLFMASDGLRLINFAANVTDPIGQYGQGLTLPMVNAVTPSRAAATFNENVYRLTVTWEPPPDSFAVWGSAQRTDDFWFHLAELGQPLERSFWTGPHSSTFVLAQPFPAVASFLVVPTAAPNVFYRSDSRPVITSSYAEFGSRLKCVLQTLLMPDSANQYAVEVIESTLFVGYNSSVGEVLVTAVDDEGQTLDQAYVWLGPFARPFQRAIPWHNKLIFRQMALNIAAAADLSLQIGGIAIREEMLNYQLPYPIPPEFVLGEDILGGPDVLGP